MYYVEDIINGVLCYRNTPNGEWHELSARELTQRLIEAKETIKDLEEQIEYHNLMDCDDIN